MPSSRGYKTGKHLEAFIHVIIAQDPRHGAAVLGALKNLLPPVGTIDDDHVHRAKFRVRGRLAVHVDDRTDGRSIPLCQITAGGRQRLTDWKEDIEGRVASLNVFLDLWSQLQAFANNAD